ncbi:hypothetical protein [Gordonia araii]|uniref:hypothetical protein n=1 Tax=Gordonia araii TaxID=263909 RepID=UPI00111010AB|nr:hypothetical protein [Gordonia araii]NNG96084.1 hypothetical protein [Gordonia araii NBRC 100433]
MMPVDDNPSSDPGWTAPNVEPAAPAAIPAGDEWQQASPWPSADAQPRAYASPEPTTQIPSLPGVDLPVTLPEPQPAPTAGLAAHKPGTTPLRPLGLADILSGAVSASRGNAGILAIAVSALWVPAIAVGIVANSVDDRLGLIVASIAAFVLPVVLTAVLAGPLHASATGRPWPTRTALRAVTNRLGALGALGVADLCILSAPAIAAGFAVVAVTEWVIGSFSAIVLLPLAVAVPVMLYSTLAAPVQMVQTVVAVEGRAIGDAVPRALRLVGRGALRQFGACALFGLLYATIGVALVSGILMFRSFGAPVVVLATGVAVTPIVAGAAVMAYIDARIRQEAYDVELLAGEEQ